MKRPIAIGLSPNVEEIDAIQSLLLLLQPWRYVTGPKTEELERWFEKFFRKYYAVAFSSGRGSIYSILRGLGIGKGDEVLTQAFTCSAVIQAILTAGAKPIFVDITKNFTMDPKDVKKKITSKTKVMLVQHTFGISADMDELSKIAKEKKIFLVEDNAHAVGNKYKSKKLGTFGIASIFSFGRDKAFSSVSGGMVITNDKNLYKKIKNIQEDNKYPSYFWVFQNLLHPVAFFYVILPLYDVFNIGKMILVLLQKCHLLSFPVNTKNILLQKNEMQKLPNAVANMSLIQLQRVEKINAKRVSVVQYYEKKFARIGAFVDVYDNPLLRYPMLVKNSQDCIQFFRKQKIYIGNWYAHVIDPKGVNLSDMKYAWGFCPQAEYIAKHIINFPTYSSLSENDLEKISDMFLNYVKSTKNTR